MGFHIHDFGMACLPCHIDRLTVNFHLIGKRNITADIVLVRDIHLVKCRVQIVFSVCKACMLIN